jgi:hypothetical protein
MRMTSLSELLSIAAASSALASGVIAYWMNRRMQQQVMLVERRSRQEMTNAIERARIETEQDIRNNLRLETTNQSVETGFLVKKRKVTGITKVYYRDVLLAEVPHDETTSFLDKKTAALIAWQVAKVVMAAGITAVGTNAERSANDTHDSPSLPPPPSPDSSQSPVE